MRALQLTVCGVASADAGAAVKKCSNEGANHKCCAKIFHRTVIALAASCLLVFIGAPSSCVYVCASFPSVRDLGKSQIFKIISISKPYSCLLSNLKPKPLWHYDQYNVCKGIIRWASSSPCLCTWWKWTEKEPWNFMRVHMYEVHRSVYRSEWTCRDVASPQSIWGNLLSNSQALVHLGMEGLQIPVALVVQKR
jgi:hypothetical protein